MKIRCLIRRWNCPRYLWCGLAMGLLAAGAPLAYAQQSQPGGLSAGNFGGGVTNSNGLFGDRTVGSTSGTTLPAAQGSFQQQMQQLGAVPTGRESAQQNQQNRQAQREFVGADSGDTTNFGSVAGQGGPGGQGRIGGQGFQGRGGQFGGAGNFFQQGNQFQTLNNRNLRRQVRTPLSVGFTFRAIPQQQVRSRVQASLRRVARFRSARSLTIQMQGRTAILRGQVASEADRLLAEQLVKLEAGVSQVRNELTIRSGGSSSVERLPPPSR